MGVIGCGRLCCVQSNYEYMLASEQIRNAYKEYILTGKAVQRQSQPRRLSASAIVIKLPVAVCKGFRIKLNRNTDKSHIIKQCQGSHGRIVSDAAGT
jgi:hypothetical protein